MMTDKNVTGDDSDWDMVIKPQAGWIGLDLGELWRYRDLVGLFVKRDFVALYKQTVLGPLWYIIQPLFTTLVFTVIFGKVAKIPTDSIPPFLFYLAGNVMWGYFSTTLTATSNTFNQNAAIFGKVYFPRLTVPLAVIIVNFLQFGIQFCLFLGFYFYFMVNGAPVFVTSWIWTLPLLLIQMAMLSFGFGILISSLTTKYKDLRFAMAFIIQLWMYATPIVYPLSQIPDWLRSYYVLNPMVSLVEGFRLAFLGRSALCFSDVISSVTVTILVVFIGVALFNRIEKTFMDTV
ncbi:ABC transporter permease [Desulfogranum mediterraneum]|uniref:ABC transporter permease n=1 Tax=Desulfogranum mediterraneum TaxID=160661 RepID=UPI00042362F1|nr:ABC transporter permease [Desulfogranum mediterraneum]